MKEISIEEKARRYDEAKYIMKGYLESGNAGVIAENTIRKAFPEFAKSENEMIRKRLLEYFKSFTSETFFNGVPTNDAIAWLEKQGERKSDWSEEDKKMSRFIGNAITADDSSTYLESKGVQVIDAHVWLDELKDRIQPKQEWSEEDKEILKDIITDVKFEGYNNDMQANSYKKINWLKKIKDRVQHQSHWKPSDEQMKALYEETQKSDRIRDDRIVSLYNDLKKPREE